MDIILNILSAVQLWGECASPLFAEFGRECIPTDLALITGCDMPVWSYTSTSGGRWSVVCADNVGEKVEYYRKRHDGAVRPCFFSPELCSELSLGDGVIRVKYGEYPQYAADVLTSAALSRELRNGRLKETGKTYTFCGNTFKEKKDDYRFVEKNELIFQKYEANELPDMMASGRTFQSYGQRLMHGAEDTAVAFIPDECREYVYEGKKYVCVKARQKNQVEKLVLSSGMSCAVGDKVWLEVAPVSWYAHGKSGLFVSEKCLVSGIRLQKQVAVPEFSFAGSELDEYLNNWMTHDIFEVFEVNALSTLCTEANSQLQNPHGFDFSEVSEEEIISGCIESGVPVFLHGASSEGKSARVRQLDPDCVVIYMRNATPDSLNGKSVVNQATGELRDIKPTWLIKLESICEREPDKKHVLFFDELTNALPSIQGSAFNIVLDREVNGMWKLPENARIVAAGNELNDSLAAYQLAEPLFNRFAHVYIQTSLDAWLLWAAENRLHPSIYTFIAANEGHPLRSEYDGQLPNADPRKWELASKLLYATKMPEMLRSLVGEGITKDFCEFCKKRIITPDEVMGGIDLTALKLNKEEKRNSVICLSQASTEELRAVRGFVKKLGEEYCALFDSLWAHGDYGRLRLIAEAKANEQ